jgi:epoxyqueuosine reductase
MREGHAAAIKAEAKRLGFSSVGITASTPLEAEARHLDDWLSRGYHADMAWMERDPARRTDPGKVLSGTRSVISVALNYYTASGHAPGAREPKISRYAWGDDYHDVVGKRLKKLEMFIRSREAGCSTRAYVDTGPVMDKAWAVRAGIGWLGKHTNVISKEFGSWLFLGTILTTLVCEHDQPITDLCGTCTACLDACPTDAFPEPYVLDARKCISYLTIEHRGEISQELADRFDGWMFGCDICQDVCPWNKFQQPSVDVSFEPRPGLVHPDPKEFSDMTQEEFSARFRGSAIKRTKHAGMIRNAGIVSESSS